MNDLLWEGCVNVRDLGGHPTEDGAVTRRGVVVRADSVRQLTPAGWDALVGYGIARIVDLRFHDELEDDPPAALPVEVVHVPLLGEWRDPQAWREHDAVLDGAADAAEYLRWSYLEFLEGHAANFARAVESVDAPGGVLVHCFAGKDRTGLVTALLLRLAGVGVARIDEDYTLSEARLAAMNAHWVARAGDDVQRRRRLRLSEAPAGVMRDVLVELERRHGGTRAYLHEAGVAEATLGRLAARLREAA